MVREPFSDRGILERGRAVPVGRRFEIDARGVARGGDSIVCRQRHRQGGIAIERAVGGRAGDLERRHRAVEPIYLRGYRHTPAITISKSTEEDLRRLGFDSQITIVPIGIEHISFVQPPKAPTPTFLYVGQLAPSKRIADMIQALAQFRAATGSGRLWLVGSGSDRYRRSLSECATRLGVQNDVVFLGHVTEEEKHRLMAEAHILLMTSVREGWGLVVTEANACGTPAVVYDVPGLRDSVRNEETGLVVAARPRDMSTALTRLTTDAALYELLAAEGKRWSQTFSFEKAAEMVGHAIARVHSQHITIAAV